MFSNAKKFFKKNILLIGIVVLLIIIAVYFLYINVKEGFGQPVSEKVVLIPVSTIEKIYNNLPNQTLKDVGAPVVELYKLFVANYNDVFDVYLQLVAANKDIEAAIASIPVPQPVNTPTGRKDDYANLLAFNKLKDQAKMDVLKKWAPQINPGIQKVLSNAIKWLPKAKQYYDTFVSNNYYGLLDGTFQQNNSSRDLLFTLFALVLNTLYEDNQLTVLLGPDFAKSSPNLPIPLPTSKEQLSQITSREPSPELMTAGRRAQEYLNKYVQNFTPPIMAIQQYLMDNAKSDPVNSVIPNTIIQLIEQLNTALANDTTGQASIGQLTGQLNTALANDATDQASIGKLTGQLNTYQATIGELTSKLTAASANDATYQASIGELTSKLTAASANDATDQATITNLQGQVYDLQSRQPPMPTQPMPTQPMPIQPLPVQSMPGRPMHRRPMPPKPATYAR